MQSSRQVNQLATIERLNQRSTWLFILLALVATAAYFLLAQETKNERSNAVEINLAGKRRMLSQQIGLLASQWQQTQKPQYLTELSKALNEMSAIHQTLTQGDPTLGIRPPRTEKLRQQYEQPRGINATMEDFVGLGNKLLNTEQNYEKRLTIANQLVAMSMGEFLNELDQMVGQYQAESEKSTDILRLFEGIALFAALSLLAFSALSVLRPLIRELKASLDDQQRFHHRLTDAIEAMDDAFALFSDKDELILYNLRFTETFALRENWLYPGISFHEFIKTIADCGLYTIPDTDIDNWLKKRMTAHHRAEGSNEINLTDGRWLRITERHTQEGGTVVIWTDVSHLKLALIAADQANNAKSEFVARMSHELRTPLNAILGFAQVLHKGIEAPLGSKQQECVGHILQGGKHLLGLINEVLDLSAIEAGKLCVDNETVPLTPLIQECLTLVSPQAGERQITLITDDAGDLCIQADPKRLKQVLLNLLSNGIKYNRIGGQLHLSITHETEQIKISVSDTGNGIAPDMADRVFEPFDRLGASNIEGTGIGLSITRRLVELMGGNIGFETTVGVGSTFWIVFNKISSTTLTATPSNREHTSLTEIATVDAISTSENFILAIELSNEDSALLALVSNTLRGAKFECVDSLSDGLEQIKICYYSVIICDQLVGNTIQQAIASITPKTQLIILTEQETPTCVDNSGSVHLQSKPLKAREIARLLRKILP